MGMRLFNLMPYLLNKNKLYGMVIILKIEVYKDYMLKIQYENKIIYFNVKPYLNMGDFKLLRNKEIFKNFTIDELGGINWIDGALSLSKDTLLNS